MSGRRSDLPLVRPLRRSLGLSVWSDLSLRFGAALALIGLVVLIHWIDRAGLKDSHDNSISLLDVVYFTMISITTTGFGDIAPISARSRLVEAVIVTPIRFAILYIFVGTAYNFLIKRSWEKWHMGRIQDRLSNHIAVLGFGVIGAEAVDELIERGTDPRQIVVLDANGQRLAAAEARGCNVMEGDATRDEALLALKIDRASAVLVCADRDDTSVLIVLTARHLAPQVAITAVIRASDNELLARQAGANNVINPVRFTGLLLAGTAQGTHVADYLTDLASASGQVQLVERTVSAAEIGHPLAAITGGLGLRVYRDGRSIGFWEPETRALEAGDTIVQITPTCEREADQPKAQKAAPISR